jgi:hypothetical protein
MEERHHVLPVGSRMVLDFLKEIQKLGLLALRQLAVFHVHLNHLKFILIAGFFLVHRLNCGGD